MPVIVRKERPGAQLRLMDVDRMGITAFATDTAAGGRGTAARCWTVRRQPHLPSGSFAANGAWAVLAAVAFDLTRRDPRFPASRPSQDRHDPRPAHHRPSRLATTARRLHLHLPRRWPCPWPWRARVCIDAVTSRARVTTAHQIRL